MKAKTEIVLKTVLAICLILLAVIAIVVAIPSVIALSIKGCEILFKFEVNTINLAGSIFTYGILTSCLVLMVQDIYKNIKEDVEKKLEDKEEKKSNTVSVIPNVRLSKEKAIELMDAGFKVAHNSFGYDEWMKKGGVGYVFEDGNTTTFDEFWRWRTEDEWERDWLIVDDGIFEEEQLSKVLDEKQESIGDMK